MSQKDALALCIGMVNAFAGVVVAYQAPDLPPMVRLLFAALVAACGFGLMFLDKIGKAPDDEPKPRRRTLREVKIDALVERVGAKDAERALQMFLDAKSDAIPQK